MMVCSRLYTRLFGVFVLFLTGFARAGDTPSLHRLSEDILSDFPGAVRAGKLTDLAVEGIGTGEIRDALDIVAKCVNTELGDDRVRTPRDSQLRNLAPLGDVYVLLRLYLSAGVRTPVSRDMLNWLFSSQDCLRDFVEVADPHDDWDSVFRLLGDLWAHDPETRDTYRNLILALALVWDQPRPPLHRQMGSRPLKYEMDIEQRYDFFRELYRRRKSEIPYRFFGIPALMLVVDTPVPVSELTWVLDNVPSRSWQKKFFEIDYDTRRLAAGCFQWPHGDYTLAAIEEYGGICVDQAYYAVLCARAYGIPALLFAGEGKRGPHAWFAYLKDRNRWEMDVGRYRYDNYDTGHALNPQTNEMMTDHDVRFQCDRSLQPARYAQAAQMARLAVMLYDLGYRKGASTAAEQSIGLEPLLDLGWTILETITREENETSDSLLELLDRKASIFRDYPDYVAAIRQQQAQILAASGKSGDAAALLSRQRTRVADKREDLARFLVSEEIRLAYEQGKFQKAREIFEELLTKQRKEGTTVFQMLEGYLTFTEKINQQKEAARFLDGFLSRLERQYRSSPPDRLRILTLLLQAYQAAGDEKNVERTKKKIALLP